ncbi:MAG TPA: YihY/virulence factor BrkB family protein [Acidimicrobiales bacterium]|nr:YihY/virulence factor BrkB family protein [Acidimicrobiales bacterium]
METIKALIERFDQWQQRHRAPAVVWAVNKKYGDDRGGYLAALIAYYGFISIFPLMLAAFSIAAFVLGGHVNALSSIYKHLANFPVLGPSVAALEKGHLSGSILAVVIGLLGLVWGATGLAKTMQHVNDEAWNVPGRERIGFPDTIIVSLEWFAVFGLGVVLSFGLSSFGAAIHWGAIGPIVSNVVAFAVDLGFYLVSFKLFTHKEATWRQLLPGAVLGSLSWTVLTGVGIGLLQHDVSHASALYGTFGTTIGLIGFVYLIARISIYGVELNVVLDRHLWPRTVTSPPLSTADRQQLIDLARREERSKDETVRVEF